MAAVTICNDFGAPQNKDCHCCPCFYIYLPWNDGTRYMILVFWMLSLRPIFSLSPFTFFKRLFSPSLSAIRVVSSEYLRLLIFLLAILLPASASSSLAFHLMYSAYKLNKEGDNIQPWCTPFPVWNESVIPCPVLAVALEIIPEYSLEGLMLKLKLQYFGQMMQRANSLKKTLMLGKNEGKRRKGQQRIRCLGSITNSMNINLSKLKDRGAWCAIVH